MVFFNEWVAELNNLHIFCEEGDQSVGIWSRDPGKPTIIIEEQCKSKTAEPKAAAVLRRSEKKIVGFGGPDRIRTGDFLLAKQAL